MQLEEMIAAAEAILFAAGESVGTERISLALGVGSDETEEILAALAAKLETGRSGLRLIRLGNKAQLCTRGEYADLIRVALETRKQPALSQAAMEVLAIIAYRQPVTRLEVELVRGVDSSYTVSSLAEKGFIQECGRREVPGRPIEYCTTEQFLRVFGIVTTEELIPLPNEPGQMTLEKAAESVPQQVAAEPEEPTE